MMKKSTLNIAFFLFATCFMISCSETIEETEIQNQEQTYFYLKNADGSIVNEIETELRMPVYEDLVSLDRGEDAENFLLTYNEDGSLNTSAISSNDLSESVQTNARALNTSFSYGYHSETIGWQYGSDDTVIEGPYYYELGTTGQSKRLEAYYLLLSGIHLCYESHIESYGWERTRCDGSLTGTTGEFKRMEATRIWIEDGQGFVSYKAHLQGIGWEPTWQYNGGIAGTTGERRRMEALRIQFYLY